jgi:hypothetical protein
MPAFFARRILAAFLILCLGHLGLLQSAAAAVVDTQTVLHLQDRAAAISGVQAALGRADVQRALESLGVDPLQAQERVSALTDAEIAVLQNRLEQLPAAGDGGWLLLVVLLTVLVVLFATGKLRYN